MKNEKNSIINRNKNLTSEPQIFNYKEATFPEALGKRKIFLAQRNYEGGRRKKLIVFISRLKNVDPAVAAILEIAPAQLTEELVESFDSKLPQLLTLASTKDKRKF